MKTTFKTDVIRTDSYEITIDEKEWNEQKLAEFSRYFHKVKSTKEIAAAISFSLMRKGAGQFLEGFGHIKTLKKDDTEMVQFIQNFRKVEEADYCSGIIVKVISVDEDIETEVEEKEVVHER